MRGGGGVCGQPTDGVPDAAERADRLAFVRLLTVIDAELALVYAQLGRLAERLEAAEDEGGGGHWLAVMERRHTLTEVRSYALAAQHNLHGALIAISKARPRRPPP